MKKLLVLMLILGMASIANATICLSVNGNQAPDVITLTPSEEITLDIGIGDILFAGGDLDIVLSNPQGALDSSGVTFINPVMTRAYFYGSWQQGPINWEGPWQKIIETPTRLLVSGGNLNNNTVGPYTLMDNLIFHCEETTDVIIDLVAFSDIISWDYDATGTRLGSHVIYSHGTLIDSIYVSQVPEPMTIALLGLGGLFLRRRK